MQRIQELVKRLIDDSINMMRRDIPHKDSAQDLIASSQQAISSTIERNGAEVDEATMIKDEAAGVEGNNSNNDIDEDDIDDREDDEDGDAANAGEEVHLSGGHLNASANVSTQVSSQGCSRVFIVKGR